jgi:hypothetical protein
MSFDSVMIIVDLMERSHLVQMLLGVRRENIRTHADATLYQKPTSIYL